MKFIALTLLLTVGLVINTTQAQEKPVTVHSIVKVYKTHDWYAAQYQLWKKEVDKDKKNTEAWLNYYAAARMAKITAPEGEIETWYERMTTIITAIETEIPNTYAYYRLKAWDTSIWNATTKAEQEVAFGYAEKAYKLNPESAAVFPDLMNYYMLKSNQPKLAEISKKWFESGDISPTTLAVNYNMLMSTKKNAILFTAGDNDTYPAIVLQQAKNVRPDVSVINVFIAAQTAEYRNNMFQQLAIPTTSNDEMTQQQLIDHIIKHKKDTPLYFAFGGYFSENEAIKDNLYNVGMALLYSEEPINNTSLLVKNFEQLFLLDQLTLNFHQEMFPEQVKRHNLSYIPGLMLLHKHYTLMENESKKNKTEVIIMQIVANTAYEDQVKKALVH